jgi:hypothetical protein
MAWRTSARYGTKQKRLDLAETGQKRVTQCSDPICLSACLFVWVCSMCARACVCGFSLRSSLVCVCVWLRHAAVPGNRCHVPLGDGGYRVRLRDRHWPRVRQNALFFHILSIYGILKQTNRMKCQYVYGL